MVVSDWNSEESLRACCKGVDVLVHLAAMNAVECAADPVAALIVNAVATTMLLEAAKKEKVRRFVYLSTAHFRGNMAAADSSLRNQPSGCGRCSHGRRSSGAD
jgi:nucleoside-diphosphate-sugar epimerase